MTRRIKVNMVASDFLLQSLVFLELYPCSSGQIYEGINLALGTDEGSAAEAGSYSANIKSVGFPLRQKSIHVSDLETEVVHHCLIRRHARIAG